MKIKRILSALVSIAVSISVFSVLPASADNSNVPLENYLDKYFHGAQKVEVDDNWFSFAPNEKPLDYYFAQTDVGSGLLYCSYKVADRIEGVYTGDKDITEIESALAEIDDSLVFTNSSKNGYNGIFFSIGRKTADGNYEDIDEQTAKNVFNSLEGDFYQFEYIYNCISGRYCSFVYPALKYVFGYNNAEELEAAESTLRSFTENNGIECELITYSSEGLNPWLEGLNTDLYGNSIQEYDCIYLVPDEEISAEEYFALANNITEDTGLTPLSYGVEYDRTFTGNTLKSKDFIEGDANCDGAPKIGDAVAVLQSIALPDKYALTEQGKFNADIDCNGITASDAIAIQKMDAER